MVLMQELNNQVVNNAINNAAVGLGALFAGLGIFLILITLFAIALYFVPTIIAVLRHSHLTLPVVLINVLLGWTLIGWVVALVMSLMEPGQASAIASAMTAPPGTGVLQLSPDKRYWWDGREWVDATVRIPPQAQRSPDGRYWWDGASWREVPAVQPAAPPPAPS